MEKIIAFLDLDGVLATRDIAFDLFRSKGFGDFFKKYSSEIADAVNAGRNFDGQKAYAGQTLEFVMRKALGQGVRISKKDIEELASGARLMPGSKRLVEGAKRQGIEVFIVSTTYKPAADVIGERLGISRDHVFATNLKIEKGTGRVIGVDGNACGGIHKASCVEKIAKGRNIPLRRSAVIGDSITDIGMMRVVVEKGGLGIAFNANNDLLMRHPSVVYAGRSLKPALGLIAAFRAKGMPEVQRLVRRNIALRKFAGVGMNVLRRPHLFPGQPLSEKAKARSETYRLKVRKTLGRLR